jgi:hypothetical protein
MVLQLDDFLSDPPLVHRGGTCVWDLGEDVLRYIDDTLKPGAKTLETGAGMSTILFAARSSDHTCIVPSEQEIDLIRGYGLRKNISLDHVHFIAGYSQNVLPTLVRENLDLVLIDGGHGYPIPAIDWFYTAPMLKSGGVVIIDDVHLWTGLELKRFLADEDAWELVRDFGKSTAYAKVGNEYAREWTFQPYIVRKSRLPLMLNLLQRAFGLLLSGEFSKLASKVRKQLKIG